MTQPRQISGIERSYGEAEVALGQALGRSKLGRLYQRGSAKAFVTLSGARPEVVFLNTSGGLAGGDRLSWSLHLGPNVKAVATSQTAERAYRSIEGPAEVAVDLRVGAGGWLDWLPQETILYDGASLTRRTSVELGADAGCLTLEAIVLGREAMGETVRSLAFRDWRQISQNGRPLLVDPLHLTDAALLSGLAGLNGARGFAAIAMVGPGVMDALEPLRRVLDEPGVVAGASAFQGKLTCRLSARSGWPLRRQIIRALSVLRQRDLPRHWQTLERQL